MKLLKVWSSFLQIQEWDFFTFLTCCNLAGLWTKCGKNQYKKKEHNQHSSLLSIGITFALLKCHRSIDNFNNFNDKKEFSHGNSKSGHESQIMTP